MNTSKEKIASIKIVAKKIAIFEKKYSVLVSILLNSSNCSNPDSYRDVFKTRSF